MFLKFFFLTTLLKTPLVVIFSANSVRLRILCIICYRQRESIVTCEIVVIPMNSRSIVLTCIKSFYHSIVVFVHLIFIFNICELSFNRDLAHCWRAFDMSNKYYLLTYLLTTGIYGCQLVANDTNSVMYQLVGSSNNKQVQTDKMGQVIWPSFVTAARECVPPSVLAYVISAICYLWFISLR